MIRRQRGTGRIFLPKGSSVYRGWVRESLYRKLKIGTNRFCQFRLAFDTREPKQAKGGLKAMSDRVADRLGVDVILPESSCKPALKGGVRFLPQLGTSGRMYTGPAILGIKELSRVSEFGSSYTLVEHASEEALQFGVMLRAIERLRKVRKAWDEGDYESLFEVIGKSEIATFDEDVSFDPDALDQGGIPVSEGWEPAEAVLLADRSGTSIKFPYVEPTARWAVAVVAAIAPDASAAFFRKSRRDSFEAESSTYRHCNFCGTRFLNPSVSMLSDRRKDK